MCLGCSEGFARRRLGAFLVDCAVLALIYFSAELLSLLVGRGSRLPGWSYFVFMGLFSLKDGFRGTSPGKWLLGLQVLDERSLQPAGFWASIKRNWLFVPLNVVAILPLSEAGGGRSCGDRWARTVVIWRRYADLMPHDRPSTLCRRCGYDLTGNVSGICPECSTAIPGFDQQAIASKGLPSVSTHDD